MLRLKKQQKTQLEYELSRLASERNRLKDEAQALRAEINHLTTQSDSAVTTPVTQLVNAMQNSARLGRMLDEKLQLHDEATRNWRKTFDAFESIRLNIESLENLKQKQMDAFRIKENRRQQQLQDDDTLRRLLSELP